MKTTINSLNHIIPFEVFPKKWDIGSIFSISKNTDPKRVTLDTGGYVENPFPIGVSVDNKSFKLISVDKGVWTIEEVPTGELEAGWLKVYECGYTRPEGKRVKVRAFYHDGKEYPTPKVGCYETVYLESGYFNLYAASGNVSQDKFNAGTTYEVMKCDATASWLKEVVKTKDTFLTFNFVNGITGRKVGERLTCTKVGCSTLVEFGSVYGDIIPSTSCSLADFVPGFEYELWRPVNGSTWELKRVYKEVAEVKADPDKSSWPICGGCKEHFIVEDARGFGAKDPTRFCTKSCEVKADPPTAADLTTAVVTKVICVTPWMDFYEGDIVTVKETGSYGGRGGRWIHKPTKSGGSTCANVTNLPRFKVDETYKILKIGPRNNDGAEWTLSKVEGIERMKPDPIQTALTTSDNIIEQALFNTHNSSEKEISMNGTVYQGTVVRNKQVQAGEGVTTGVVVSEVVYSTKAPFIALNAEMARAKILVDAKLALKDGLDLESTLETLEVKLSVPNG